MNELLFTITRKSKVNVTLKKEKVWGLRDLFFLRRLSELLRRK